MVARRWWIVLVVMAVATAACGSRLSSEEIRAQSAKAGTSGGDSTAAAVNGTDASRSGGTEATGAAGATNAAGQATSGTVGAGGKSTAGPTATTKAPITIGVVGSFSGIAGPSSRPVADAWAAWSKMINAKGGINGHAVRVLIGDDGGNASRTVALAQDFVENKGAVALSFHGPDPSGVANYAKNKNIPVIGTTVGTPLWQQNPMLFPATPGVDAASWGQVRAAKDAGASKLAIVYCAESPICKAGADLIASQAKQQGVQITYSGQITISAPDYTADCLQIRNSGAQAVALSTENGSALRLADSCGRQGFHPIYATSAADDRMGKSADFENAIAVDQAFSWFLRGGNPAVDEYANAIRKYVPSRLTDGNSLQAAAWVSAKVFEAAAAKVGDKPTSQDILNGLYALRGDSISGLAPGGLARTYNRGQPTAEVYCVFIGRAKGGKWTGNLTPLCR